MEYEAVIGLEVHVQLKTKTKLFTDVPYRFGAGPNELTNPVVWALPGVLPVINREAIRKTIKTGLIFGCRIPELTKWDRKNYFYPDSPKNYQLSQYDMPLCLGGEVEIELPGANPSQMGEHRKVKLTRIHLEEDVGKLTHCASDSLVDYNRAGVPLMEIVSEPDMHTADEVFAYLNALKSAISFAGISDCDMEKGQMRADVNISVRPKGDSKLGVKVEMKNMNSPSNVKDCVDYEIRRQIACVSRGEKLVQQTRRWDVQQRVTQPMRTKEMAHDYRYFPDPDLMPVKISPELVEKFRAEIPEMPFARQRRYMEEYGLPYSATSVICHDRELCEFFEGALREYSKNPRGVANLLANDLLRELSAAREGAAPGGADSGDSEAKAAGLAAEDSGSAGSRSAAPADTGFGGAGSEGGESAPGEAGASRPAGAGSEDCGRLCGCKISPASLAGLVRLTDGGSISKQMAKEVFAEMFATGQTADEIVAKRGLVQNSDSGELEKFCLESISKNAKAVNEYKAGNEKAINALIGPVMKLSKGKANPAMVLEIMKRLIK